MDCPVENGTSGYPMLLLFNWPVIKICNPPSYPIPLLTKTLMENVPLWSELEDRQTTMRYYMNFTTIIILLINKHKFYLRFLFRMAKLKRRKTFLFTSSYFTSYIILIYGDEKFMFSFPVFIGVLKYFRSDN